MNAMNTTNTYFAAVHDGIIYGIGTTESDAIQDAVTGAGYPDQAALEARNSPLSVLPMTQDAHVYVLTNGFDGTVDGYRTERGVIVAVGRASDLGDD